MTNPSDPKALDKASQGPAAAAAAAATAEKTKKAAADSAAAAQKADDAAKAAGDNDGAKVASASASAATASAAAADAASKAARSASVAAASGAADATQKAAAAAAAIKAAQTATTVAASAATAVQAAAALSGNKDFQKAAAVAAAAAQAAQTAASIAAAASKVSDPGQAAAMIAGAAASATAAGANIAQAAGAGEVAGKVAMAASAAGSVVGAATAIAGGVKKPSPATPATPTAPAAAPETKTPHAEPAAPTSADTTAAAEPTATKTGAPDGKSSAGPKSSLAVAMQKPQPKEKAPEPKPKGPKPEPKAKPKPSGFASARFFFKTEAYSDDELVVLGFEGAEALSRLFEFEIELVSMEKKIDFKKIVGQPATLKINGPDADRYVHGIVTRMELTDVLPHRSVYRVTLLPPMVKLEYKRRLRVYQKKTTQEIVKIALKEVGIGDGDQIWNISAGDYIPRDYCVQYRETDLDFINRLLCEDGITYHFSHDEKGIKVVFHDAPAAYQDIEPDIDGATVMPYSDQLSMEEPYEFINSLVFGRQLHVEHVQLRDYEFSKPSVATVGNSAKKDDTYAVYEYPGDFVEPGLHAEDLQSRASELQGLSNRRAKLKQEAFAADGEKGNAASDSNRLLPGFCFTLGMKEPKLLHPQDWLNAKYLLVEVRHRAEQKLALDQDGEQAEPAYGNEIEFIPAEKQYRPPEVPPKPRVFGLHTALVVGPQGEEIYTDKYGRVKVRFHWEREASQGGKVGSCWIRVSQNWGGQSWGGMFIPRVGQEVLVSFLEGDPDRPIIIGRVYNGEQPVPYELPLHKTRSTIKSHSTPGGGGFNEIRFEDKKGAEEIFTHAQKDQNEVVLHDHDTKVGNDQSHYVKRNRTKKIDGFEEVRVKEHRHEWVDKDEKITIKKDRKRVVTEGDDLLVVEKGSQTVQIDLKDRNVIVKTGNDNLMLSNGNREVKVKKGYFKVTAEKNSLILWAATELTAYAKKKFFARGREEVEISGKNVLIKADKSLVIQVGNNRISLDPEKIVTNGIEINSQAVGTQTITGAIVKIN